MRTIDLDTRARRDAFKLFSTYSFPQFGWTAPVDRTAFRPAVQQRSQTVVEHEVVHPAITLLTGDAL